MIRLTDLITELSELLEVGGRSAQEEYERRKRQKKAKEKWKAKTGTPGSTWTTHTGTKATRQADGSVKYERIKKSNKKKAAGPGKDFGKTWKLEEDGGAPAGGAPTGGIGLTLPGGYINGAPKPKKVKQVRKALNREKHHD